MNGTVTSHTRDRSTSSTRANYTFARVSSRPFACYVLLFNHDTININMDDGSIRCQTPGSSSWTINGPKPAMALDLRHFELHFCARDCTS